MERLLCLRVRLDCEFDHPGVKLRVRGLPVLVVDHTSLPGGAELALPRMARHSSWDLRFLFLESNFTALGFPEDAVVVGPDGEIGVLRQLALLRRHLRSGDYGAVVSNTLRAAVFIALVNGSIPHFMYLQDGADRNSLSWTKRMLLNHLVLPRVARVFPNSSWTGESLGIKHAGKVSAPVFSPSGGRDIAPAGKQELQQSESTPLKLLSLSRIVEWKGLHVVMEALSILSRKYDGRQLTLTVAGGNLMGPDSYLADLIAKARELPFDVDFVGHQDDVLVHASIRPEPFGQVIVQGLSAQLAVIASDAGGPAEIIQHERSGLLHRAGDAQHLAAQIEILLTDPERAVALRRAGLARSTTFNDASVISLFDEELTIAISGSAV
jgi:glycosyltransferase involved in cell wall biosynthesis